MRPLLVAAIAAFGLFTQTARAEKHERPELVVTREGNDLKVLVNAVTDYCATDADITILRSSDAIRILQERPTRVSRCITTRERSFVIKDVAAGRYMISFERMPLVAPARPIRIAWSHFAVH